MVAQQQSDSNLSSTNSNPNSSKGYFDKLIRIIIQAIRIRVPEKVWMAAQQQSDSNPSSTNSNPNSSKEYFDGLIWITNQVIRITSKKEEKLRVTDSNYPYSDSNPSWRKMKRLKHRFESPTQLFESLIKNKTKRFKSLSYRFESLHKWSKRLKVRQSDSNHRVTDSNHSFGIKFKYCKGYSNHLNTDSKHLLYKSINYSTCTLQQLDFSFESLSQQLVEALQRSLMIK